MVEYKYSNHRLLHSENGNSIRSYPVVSGVDLDAQLESAFLNLPIENYHIIYLFNKVFTIQLYNSTLYSLQKYGNYIHTL